MLIYIFITPGDFHSFLNIWFSILYSQENFGNSYRYRSVGNKFFSFCSFENIFITPLFLKNIFTGSQGGWFVVFLLHFEEFHWLLDLIFCFNVKLLIINIIVFLVYIRYNFSLAAFKILSFVFQQFDYEVHEDSRYNFYCIYPT